MDQLTLQVAIIMLIGLSAFLILAFFVIFKNVKDATPGEEMEHPSIMVINVLMLAMDMCQDTLIRLKKGSDGKTELDVFEIFFDEIYSYILKNEHEFDPEYMEYFRKIDRTILKKISFNIIIHFIKELDTVINNQKPQEISEDELPDNNENK